MSGMDAVVKPRHDGNEVVKVQHDGNVMVKPQQTKTLDGLRCLWRRDRLLLSRQQGTWLNPLLFYVLLASLFPLSLSLNEQVLQQIGPGVIWVGALIATYMTLDPMLRGDYQDGTLVSWRIGVVPLPLTLLVRLASHWVFCGLPLALVAIVLACMYHLSFQTILGLELGLVLGTWIMSGIGAIGLSLTLAVERGGVLLAVIVLPLYVPVLILGSLLAQAASQGLLFTGTGLGLLSLLAAIAVGVLCLAPWFTAMVINELVE